MLNQAFNAKPYNDFDPQVGLGGRGGESRGTDAWNKSNMGCACIWLACQGDQGPEQAGNDIGLFGSQSRTLPEPQRTQHPPPQPFLSLQVLHIPTYLFRITVRANSLMPHFAFLYSPPVLHRALPRPQAA